MSKYTPISGHYSYTGEKYQCYLDLECKAIHCDFCNNWLHKNCLKLSSEPYSRPEAESSHVCSSLVLQT